VDRFLAKADALPPMEGPEVVAERESWMKMRQDRADYASMVFAMDENVGRLLDRIKALGLEDDTIVIFTSDNGGLSTVKGKNAPTSDRPLRAGKGWAYEGGIRVPLIARVPGQTRAGSVCAEPVTSVDFFPTLLALTGVGRPEGSPCDGIDLTPVLRDPAASLGREAIYWHYPHYHGSGAAPAAAMRAGDWKLIKFYDEGGRIEVYNLKDDLSETRDLAAGMPEKARELESMLSAWQRSVGAKIPRPIQPGESPARARSRKAGAGEQARNTD
jgi:arylsulfatase A-like enzyme